MTMHFNMSKFKEFVSPQVSIGWIGTAAALFIFSFQGVNESDYPLSSVTGIPTSYSFARGGDFSLMLKLKNSENQKLFFSQYRSSLTGQISDHIGREVTIKYYGNKIDSCWDGTTQFCFSKCQSDAQCNQDQDTSDTKLLRLLAAVCLFSYISIFIYAAFFRK